MIVTERSGKINKVQNFSALFGRKMILTGKTTPAHRVEQE